MGRLNILKATITLFLMVPTVLIMNVDFCPDLPLRHWYLLILSGVLGIAIADTLFFASLSRLGAGYTAIIEALYLPSVMFLSFIFLNENIGTLGILGAVLVGSAILFGNPKQKKKSTTDTTENQDTTKILIGTVLGLMAVLSIAVSIVIIKNILADVDVLFASYLRVLAGTVTLYVITLLSPLRKQAIKALKPSNAWRSAVPAAICGNYLAMIFWLIGMKFAPVSISAILNQLSTAFIFLFAVLFLKEKLTPIRVISVCLAVTGAILASVSHAG